MTYSEFQKVKVGDYIYEVDSILGPQKKIVTQEDGHNGRLHDKFVSLSWLFSSSEFPHDKEWHPYRAYERTYEAAEKREMH